MQQLSGCTLAVSDLGCLIGWFVIWSDWLSSKQLEQSACVHPTCLIVASVESDRVMWQRHSLFKIEMSFKQIPPNFNPALAAQYALTHLKNVPYMMLLL